MRPIVALLCTSLIASAHAETAENLMRSALSNVASQPACGFVLDGFESIDKVRTNFSVNTFVKVGAKTATIEARVFRDGRLVQRVVGDGENLWSYSFLRNEYSCLPYTEDAANPAMPMARQFGSALTSIYAPVSQLIYDTYARGGANWRPMVGLSKVEVWDPTPPVQPNYVIFVQSGESKTAPRMKTYYDISVGGAGYALQSIDYQKLDMLGQQNRVTEWHMDVYWQNFVPSQANFTFVPPKGARSITVSPKVR